MINIIIGVIIFALMGLAVRSVLKKKGGCGCGCGGGCPGCNKEKQ